MSKRGIQSATREIFKNPMSATPIWHVIDAKGHVVGRVAQMVSNILLGKHKPVYDPSMDSGDYVVVVNARHAQFTGSKFDNKYYKWHSGYPGGLKTRSVQGMLEKNPTKILHHAIMGMIPKNRLKALREKKLKLYADDQHPHANQIIASSNSPIQRNIPVNELFQKHMSISEDEEHLVGGRHMKLHKTKEGDVFIEEKKVIGLLERAKINRNQTRMAQVGELKQYYQPNKDKVLPDTVEHNFELGSAPARIPWKSEPTFQIENTGSQLWNWPKPDEKFEENADQLGRIMTEEEVQAIVKKEEGFALEDKWRLIMRLTRVQMQRAARMKVPVPQQYVEACRQIPTQFLIDEKDSDKRMREAMGILETVKGSSNDLEFGDFSFGGKERKPEDLKKLPTCMQGAAASAAKPGAKPVGKK